MSHRICLPIAYPAAAILFLAGLFCLMGLSARAAKAQPAPPAIRAEDSARPLTHISPTDPRIRYDGRFDLSDPAGPRCAWPACAAYVSFRASALDVELSEAADASNEYEIVLDGSPTAVLIPQAGEHAYRVYSGSGGKEHTLGIVKRTEAFCGTGQFCGFDLSAGGKLLNAPAERRGIEVIGDSISCGYGDEAASNQEHFTPATENAYLAYGAVAARAFGARYFCLAWSGKKMWPNNTLPELYGRAIPTDANSTWDFSRWQPDVAIINLSTNDWFGGAPDEAGWTAAYEAFIRRVRGYYPEAAIYCMSSPMMSGQGRDQSIAYLTKIVADCNAAGDKQVHLLVVPTQDPADGMGADWHPNVKTHAKDAALVEAAIEKDLGWKPVGK